MDLQETPLEFNKENIQSLKEKYSQEMRDDTNNPIKICLSLVYNAATEKHPQKRVQIAEDLSKFLIQPKGCVNLFLSLIDFDQSSQKATSHSTRFLAVANVITRLPELCLPYEQYCANISRQLKPLLISENPLYSSLAAIIFGSMLDSQHSKGRDIAKIVLTPITQAFVRVTNSVSTSDAKLLLYQPDEAIIAAHNLIQNRFPSKHLISIFSRLFYVAIELHNSPSRLKHLITRSLASILADLQPGSACCLLEETIFYKQHLASMYHLHSTENGEISVKVTTPDDDKRPHENKVIETVTLLIEESASTSLIVDFFFHFKDMIVQAKDDHQRRLSAALVEPMLEDTVAEKASKLDLLSAISDNLEKSVELVVRTLLNHTARLNSPNKNETDEQALHSDSLNSCLNILKVLQVATEVSDEGGPELATKSLPVLRRLHEIASHNHKNVKSDILDSISSLIEKMEQDKRCDKLNADKKSQERKSRELDNILVELNDKLVPNRVHALVKLKQLVMANDALVMERVSQLYDLVESSLADPEPYVFLAAINLLAEAALRRTDTILPKLLHLFQEPELDLQHRINTGEVLVRLVRQLNDTAPHYAQQVMPVLLSKAGVGHPEELVRSSSLANIGELCQLLGDSLGRHLIDILTCIESVILTDTLEVKRAAAHLLRTTLAGLDGLRSEGVQLELKRLYGQLKQLKASTLDDTLHLQVDLALDEVDRLAHEILFGQSGASGEVEGGAAYLGGERSKLVKNIKVRTRIP